MADLACLITEEKYMYNIWISKICYFVPNRCNIALSHVLCKNNLKQQQNSLIILITTLLNHTHTKT